MSIMQIIDTILGRSHHLPALREQARELVEARGALRENVSGLGQEIWGMVETGDPLRALAHGARTAQFASEQDEQARK